MKQSTSKKIRKMLPLFLLVVLCGMASQAFAEACTYREAIMALEQGNVDRGMALMRMASRDGDQRAANFLQEQDYAQVVGVKDAFVAEAAPLVTGEKADFK